jgi:hypothetical protein
MVEVKRWRRVQLIASDANHTRGTAATVVDPITFNILRGAHLFQSLAWGTEEIPKTNVTPVSSGVASHDEIWTRSRTITNSLTLTTTNMRLNTFALVALAFVAPSCAQYFSAGWTPGQAVPTHTPEPSSSSLGAETTPLPPPPPPPSGQSRFDLSHILSSGPVSQFLNRFGINVTESLEAARGALPEIWDSRIPLVTDDNFNELIVNEELTDEEEKHRVWLLIM